MPQQHTGDEMSDLSQSGDLDTSRGSVATGESLKEQLHQSEEDAHPPSEGQDLTEVVHQHQEEAGEAQVPASEPQAHPRTPGSSSSKVMTRLAPAAAEDGQQEAHPAPGVEASACTQPTEGAAPPIMLFIVAFSFAFAFAFIYRLIYLNARAHCVA
jgi:hypothetical protein